MKLRFVKRPWMDRNLEPISSRLNLSIRLKSGFFAEVVLLMIYDSNFLIFQQVYASPSRHSMESKGKGAEMCYPNLFFTVDDFDQVSQMIPEELYWIVPFNTKGLREGYDWESTNRNPLITCSRAIPLPRLLMCRVFFRISGFDVPT